jgi:hypothetical protein
MLSIGMTMKLTEAYYSLGCLSGLSVDTAGYFHILIGVSKLRVELTSDNTVALQSLINLY